MPFSFKDAKTNGENKYFCMLGMLAVFLKKIFDLFIFRERGRVGEREEEKYQCMVASCAPPTGDLAYNPGMFPD